MIVTVIVRVPSIYESLLGTENGDLYLNQLRKMDTRVIDNFPCTTNQLRGEFGI